MVPYHVPLALEDLMLLNKCFANYVICLPDLKRGTDPKYYERYSRTLIRIIGEESHISLFSGWEWQSDVAPEYR